MSSPAEWPYLYDDANPLISQKSFPAGSYSTNQSAKNFRVLRDLLNNWVLTPALLVDIDSMLHMQIDNVNGDAIANGQNLADVRNWNLNYDPTTGQWGRERFNGIVYANASDAATSTFTSPTNITFKYRSILAQFNVTTFTGTSWAPEIDLVDSNGNTQKYWVKPTALTATANVDVIIGPGCSTAALGANTGILGQTQTDAATGNQTFMISAPVPRAIKLVITKTAAASFAANYTIEGMS